MSLLNFESPIFNACIKLNLKNIFSSISKPGICFGNFSCQDLILLENYFHQTVEVGKHSNNKQKLSLDCQLTKLERIK